MTSLRSCVVVFALLAITLAANPLDFVNPFIGTEGSVPGTAFNGGNVFPGASLPFGAVKVGIDTTTFNQSTESNGGYTPDGFVTGISMLHESGTGGAPKYGVVPQMPLTTLEGINIFDNITYMQARKTHDTASVGYYKTELESGVTAEISASRHAGIIRYSFPEGEKHVLVDISHYLPTNGETEFGQVYSNGRIDLGEEGMYSGYGIWRGGWNNGPDYQVFFCGKFDTAPAKSQLFAGPYTDPYWPNSTNVPFQNEPAAVPGDSIIGGPIGYDYADRIAALFTFPQNSTTVTTRVGVSWISADKACAFLESEIPTYDLNTTVAAAQEEWTNDVLNTITISNSSNQTRLEMFYSALYKSHLLPSDRTGENPIWRSEEPYYDDYYTLWDTFRCLNSFYLLIQPERAAGMVRSLIDIWRHERFMPDGRSGNYNGRVQGGSNADNVLADAYVKGLGYSINWTDGYAAMKTDAEVPPYNTWDAEDLTQSTKEGRGALSDWLSYGFVTPNFGRSLSKTVEYSLNDFALSQVAKGLAPQDYDTYLNRSAGWQNLWNHSITSLNFTGFLAPKYANGTAIKDYDPTSCGACEWNSLTYEALPWEYSWTVPFDMETLIEFMGGPNATEARLDEMFKPGFQASRGSDGTNGIGSTIFNPGNEPSFATPFLYNYLQGRQYKSVLNARQTINTFYNNGPSGLPGNSDAGALDSWMIWNMLGFYPVVTQPIYLLLSPWFDDISIELPATDSILKITAEGLTDEIFFVQSVTINGTAWNKSWVTHDDIAYGGRIHFVLGSEMTSWDEGELPPSPGHVDLSK